MQMTLRELLDHGLMTLDEVTELGCYLTTNPESWWDAPEALREKAARGVVLLDLEAPSRLH